MNVGSWLLWSFVATLLMTIIGEATQGLRLTRMNFPYLLGTMFTPDRSRAKLYGFLVHVGVGMLFSLLYVLIFQSIGTAGFWRGVLIGIAHALFVLLVVMSLLPGLHPRMASEQQGPEAHKVLEPPGFLALHYGVRTPVAILLSHVVYGAILGTFYQLR